MLFVLTPQNPSPSYYDPEETFLEFKRREYIAALQEQQQRTQFQRELAMEEERHRIALATIARQEAARRQRQAQPSVRFARPTAEPQCAGRFCRQPAPEEILARRLAREQEEQRRSRQFHEHILSQIFGVPAGESSQQPAAEQQTSASTSTDKGKQSTVKKPRNEEPEPHWSAAPERARALAEIAGIDRTFRSLINTFVMPSGQLERLPDTDLPRLAYNSTNATIHSHEHALAELLTKLDGVESYGFRGVREARKQLVIRIGKELEKLEQKVSERLAGAASPATASVSVPDVVVPVQEVQHKEAEDVVMIDEHATNAEAAPAGYDVEPVEETTQTLAKAVEEPIAESTSVSQAMEMEPVVPAAAEVTLSRPASPAPTPATPAVPQEVTDSTANAAKAAPTTSLEESTSDEEESEIEDAVHIVIENDEAVAHDQRGGDASDQEVEYELI